MMFWVGNDLMIIVLSKYLLPCSSFQKALQRYSYLCYVTINL